ncbi:MAG: ACT domain-containing protein [Planctomycetia bacterium]|nr:ACT domain-containing protein [Planctomycetia bacterium]
MIETIKQVSVFLENKPGRLAKVLSALAKEKVNVTALTVMDSHEHSALRLVTGDPAKTVQVLNAHGFRHAESDVLLVELKNQPGALAHVCELLANDHINIDYCYASSGGRNGKVFGVFKATNLDRAKQLLGGTANNKRPERKPLRDKRIYSGPAR